MPNIQLRNRIRAAMAAFKEPYLVQNIHDLAVFDEYDARMARYAIQWGFYDNTVYRNIHSWAEQYRLISSLYINTRAIRNPSYRIGSFHQNHIWGGLLDMEAGNGKEKPSALPIETENEKLRPVIADMWLASNWQIKKDLVTLQGTVMGDACIRVVDSTKHEKIYMEAIHPRLIKDLTKDEFGNVKAYVLEEERPDPRKADSTVTYTEIAGRDDNNTVFFETLLDGSPYPWNIDVDGTPMTEWTVPYGFIPLVHVQHIDVGGKFGWAETHAARPKIEEINDQASKLDDYIRKATEGVFFFSGVAKPTGSLKPTTTTASRDKPDPKREDVPGLWGGVDSKATPLLFNLDISATLKNLQALADDIAKDYPELMIDENKELSNAMSGRALRILQTGANNKIEMRRPAYDDALVRAQQMGMSMGAERGYEGYAGIGTFEAGDFEHNIAQRPVFKVDEIDRLEEINLFWQTAAIANGAGIPLEVYLKRQGWKPEEIAEVRRTVSRSESMTARRAARETITVNTDEAVNETTSQDIIEENRQDIADNE